MLIHYLHRPVCAQNVSSMLPYTILDGHYVVIKPGSDKALQLTHELALTVVTYLLQ